MKFKKLVIVLTLILILFFLSACSKKKKIDNTEKANITVNQVINNEYQENNKITDEIAVDVQAQVIVAIKEIKDQYSKEGTDALREGDGKIDAIYKKHNITREELDYYFSQRLPIEKEIELMKKVQKRIDELIAKKKI